MEGINRLRPTADEPHKHHTNILKYKFLINLLNLIPRRRPNTPETAAENIPAQDEASEAQSNRSRFLYIHAGGGKTGSSALQNYLELNEDELARNGFFYGNRLNINSKYQITSGNGALLCKSLLSASISDDEIDGILASYFGNFHSAICSSELFCLFECRHWQRVVESTARLAIKLKVIIYVRNPGNLHQSGFDQAIKRHGEYRAFSEWAKSAAWPHGEMLRTLSSSLSISDLVVIHYDENREGLIPSFLQALGIPIDFTNKRASFTRNVNRSLTAEEREILCLVNSRFGDAYSSELSDFFIYNNPEIETNRPLLDCNLISNLSERFSDEIKWVNDKFFDGKPVVQLFSDRPVYDVDARLMGRQEPILLSATGKAALLWTFGKMNDIKVNADVDVARRILSLARSSLKEAATDLPPDFDVLSYLLLNPDVFISNTDPIKHYQEFGMNEGRRYSLQSELGSNQSRY